MPEFTPPEVIAVMGLIETYNQWKNVNGPPRGFERYHPSAFGKCLRKMQYERYEELGYVEGVSKIPEAFMCRIWETGHTMHDRWRGYFEALGVLKGYWQCNNPFCKAYENNGHINPDALKYYQDGNWNHRTRWYGKDQLQGCFKPAKCICGCKDFTYHEIDVVSKELNFYGHCDMVLDFSNFDPNMLLQGNPVVQVYAPECLPKKPVVVDMKTINMFDFQDLDKDGPAHEYMIQLTIYANILDCESGILIYENKNNSKTKIFQINKNTDTVWAEVRKQALEMNEMVEVLDEDGNVHHLLPPPRPTFPDDEECSRCQFSSQCHESSIWNDPDLDQKRKDFYGILLK